MPSGGTPPGRKEGRHECTAQGGRVARPDRGRRRARLRYDDRSYDEDYPDDEFADPSAVVRHSRRRPSRRGRGPSATPRGVATDRSDADTTASSAPTTDASERRLSRSADQRVRPMPGVADRSGCVPTSGRTYPTHDNLALAPERQTEPEVRSGGQGSRRRSRRRPSLPDHHAAPDDVQRRPHDRRALPRRRTGDHEPHRDG